MFVSNPANSGAATYHRKPHQLNISTAEIGITTHRNLKSMVRNYGSKVIGVRIRSMAEDREKFCIRSSNTGVAETEDLDIS